MILRGEPVPMFGDGSSRRDHTHGGAIAAGLATALDRTTGPHLDNLGHADPVPLRTLIAALGTALGREPIINHLPPQPGDVGQTHADIIRARADLGYDPRTSRAAGLARSVAWLRTTPPTWFAKRTHRPQPVCRQ